MLVFGHDEVVLGGAAEKGWGESKERDEVLTNHGGEVGTDEGLLIKLSIWSRQPRTGCGVGTCTIREVKRLSQLQMNRC